MPRRRFGWKFYFVANDRLINTFFKDWAWFLGLGNVPLTNGKFLKINEEFINKRQTVYFEIVNAQK